MYENSICEEIVDAAIAIQRELGPGLLETVVKRYISLRIRAAHGFTRKNSIKLDYNLMGNTQTLRVSGH